MDRADFGPGLDPEDGGEEINASALAGEGVSQEDALDYQQYRQDTGKPTQSEDRVWRSAPGWGSDDEGLLRPTKKGRARLTREEALEPGPLLRHAERLKRLRAAQGKDERDEPYIEREPQVELSPEGWRHWAEAAGLSEWEKKAVEYKMTGVGWTEAMAEQKDDASRRALQAAWRKLERSGEERLRRSSAQMNADEREPEKKFSTGCPRTSSSDTE
jgi:hypothetical protein